MSENFSLYSGGVKDPRKAERFIVSKTQSGRTLVTRKPIVDSPPEYTGTPKSMRKVVRLAVTYAEFACDQSIYQSRAVGSCMSAYNLAVADYLGRPQVLDIDLRDWRQDAGQKIHIKAKDNFMVLSVRLVIRDDVSILEEGEAVQATSGSLWWTYPIKMPIDREPGLYLDAFAYDLPGNVGKYGVELR